MADNTGRMIEFVTRVVVALIEAIMRFARWSVENIQPVLNLKRQTGSFDEGVGWGVGMFVALAVAVVAFVVAVNILIRVIAAAASQTFAVTAQLGGCIQGCMIAVLRFAFVIFVLTFTISFIVYWNR